MDQTTLVLEGLPADFDTMTPELVLHFKNKKNSGGEAVQIVEHPKDKRKALLIYQSVGDAQNVLAKVVHKLGFKDLGTVELRVKMQKSEKVKPLVPPRRKKKEEAVIEGDKDFMKILAKKDHEFGITMDLYGEDPVPKELDPRRFILSGFKETCDYKLIPLLINGSSQKVEHSWELVDADRIVVTFKKDIDVNSFLTKSTMKLLDNDFKASQMELTDSVLVEGDLSQIKEDILTGHFSNNSESGGGDIKSVRWINKQKSVVITFMDYQAAYRVVEQSHHLSGADLTALLFYSSLEKALTGQTPSFSEIQTSITIPVDEEVLGFIVNNQQCRNDLQSQLKMVRSSVDFEERTLQRKLVVEMDVEKESLAAIRIGPTWEKKARKATQEFLSKYSAVKVPVQVMVWKSVESTCLKLIAPEADIFFQQANSKIVIVGLTGVVNGLSDKIKIIVMGATTEQTKDRKPTDTQIKETSINSMPLKSEREMEFIQTIMNLSGIPEIGQLGISLKYSWDAQRTPYLKVTAAKEKIQDAVSVVKKQLSSIAVEKLTYSKPGESKVLTKNEYNLQAKAKELNCKLYFDQLNRKCGPAKSFQYDSGCIVLTVALGDLHRWTADALVCPMTTNLAFDNPTAQQFLNVGGSQIQEVFCRLQKEKQALLSGDVVPSNAGKLSAKTLLYAVLPQGSQPLGPHYLKSAILSCLHKAEEKNSESLAMPVLGFGTFEFSMEQSCTAIREAILQFICDHQNAPKNLRNIFVVGSDIKVLEEFNILVAKQGFSSIITPPSPASMPTEVTVPDLMPKSKSEPSVNVYGVLVSLKRGDITKETVDVIVSSNNWDLSISSGVCGAIFRAAGKSVEKEYIQSDPVPGEVTCTAGGNLPCRFIAHMFGPSDAADITDLITKVLQLCETEKAATVAVPAIGTGRGGISAYESISAIFTAVENHLIYLKSSALKKITVVAFDQIIWDAFQDYFTQKHRQSFQATKPTLSNQVNIKETSIEIKKGDITTETTQAIVNTTNRTMNLRRGVSRAIFEAAGPSVESECQKLEPLEDNKVAVTSAGNLKCDSIIHMRGPRFVNEVHSRVMKVLEQCEQKKISTISFPAIGTGGGGLKGKDAMKAMLQAFGDHLSQKSLSALKQIYVVVDRDEVLQEFQTSFSVWAKEIQDDGDEDEDDEDLPEEENRRSSAYFQYAAEVFWDLETGFDLDKLDPELKAFFYKCGISEAQLKDKWTSTVLYDFIVRKGGLQAFKEGMKKEVGLMQMMKEEQGINEKKNKTFKKKEQKKKLQKVDIGKPQEFRHVSHAGFDPDTMSPELKNFFSRCGISEAQFRDKETAKVISDFIQKKGGMEAVNEQFQREVSKPPQTNESNPSPSRKPLCFLSEMASISFPATTVEVYGTSPASLSKVKKLLDDLISEECTSKELKSSYLANLTEADKEAIVTLCKKNQVHILVASSDELTVSGKKDDVLDTMLNISTILQEAKDRENHEFEKRRLSQTLHWEVAEGESWVPLDAEISYNLELAFHKKEQVFTYRDEGEVYTVDFKELTRQNKGGTSCRIRRSLIGDSDTAIIQPPPTWTKMEERDLEIIVLTPTSEEFKKIEATFLTSSKRDSIPPVQIVQIRRIQNKGLWQRYCVLKQAVDKKYPNQNNEQFLYHGTTNQICLKINKNGFNRSFCGRNAVVHGEGTYFAKEAWYSCQDKYSNPDPNGLKYIYRARVVTGSPCKSRQGMKEPDPLDPKDPRAGLHNCAVDDLQNPFIFVVFCDAGAYPDYLITFKNA